MVVNYNVANERLKAVTKGDVEPLSYVTEITSNLESDIKANNSSKINRRVDFEIVN